MNAKDPICHDCKEELLFRTNVQTLDYNFQNPVLVRTFYCPNCKKIYIKNRFDEYVKGIGYHE